MLGILLMADTCCAAMVTTTFAKDLTELDPPAHVQLVDQAKVPLVSEVTVVHCDPDVAADSPQRSWYTVYVPVTTESH